MPLVEGGTLQGVLVVQTHEPRAVLASEVRMLVTVAAQLAALVGDALLLEQVSAVAHPPPRRAVGRARRVGHVSKAASAQPRHRSGPGLRRRCHRRMAARRAAQGAARPEDERVRLTEAMDRARDEIARLSQRISELVGEDHGAILQAQLMIMQDRTIEHDLDACLRSRRHRRGRLCWPRSTSTSPPFRR